VEANPPVTARHLCGAVTLHIQAGGPPGTAPSSRQLATETVDSGGMADRDSLTLVCEP
jgi:hypothetical protein